MLGKILILTLFVAIIISLFSSLYFLLTDNNRILQTLKLRIIFSLLLIFLIAIGFYSGYIHLHKL